MKQLLLGLVVCLAGTPSAPARAEGTIVVEDPLEAGRAWLVRHQNLETGLWSSSQAIEECTCSDWGEVGHDPGVTGLALLALLGQPGRYEDEIRSGVQGLLRVQDRGLFGQRGHLSALYNHAIALWAICEAMDRASIDSEECRVAAQKGVEMICSARNPRGGWRYALIPNSDQDSSLTTWCVLALASARRAGLEVDDEHFQGAYRLFRNFTDPDTGRIGYNDTGTASSRVEDQNDNYSTDDGEALTAASLHALGCMGMASKEDRRWRASFALLEDTPALWRDDFGADMYFLMHGAAALQYVYPTGDCEWVQTMRDAVLPEQRTKKCWEGSWDPAGPWGFSGGRVYSTAAMVLALDPLITSSLEMEELGSSGRKYGGVPGPGLLSPEDRKGVKRSRKSLGMITDGLAWLAKHQAEDGYWSDLELRLKCDHGARGGVCEASEYEAKLTCTALALLAFMGEGHYAGQDGPYRQNLELALSFVVDAYRPAAPAPNQAWSGARDFGIADRAFPALAIIEAAGGVADEDLQALAKRVAQGLLDARLDDGGWCRCEGIAGRTDGGEVIPEQGATTATALTLIALLRAQTLGLIELPDRLLPEARRLATGLWLPDGSRALCSADTPDPVSFYTKTGQVQFRGDAPTAAALLIERLATGAERDFNRDCKKHLTNMVPARKNHEATYDDALAWFLLNIAFHPNSKTLGKKWHKGVESALDDFQASKGCAEGSWNTYCYRTLSWGGRVYSTSIAILCLQTPLWGEALFGD